MNREFLKHAGIGAAAMVATGFVPFGAMVAPLVGGGVAGWLDERGAKRGAKVGGAAGAIGSIPLVTVLLLWGTLAVVEAASALVVLLVTVLFGAALLTGFGALGGAIGAELATESTADADRERTEDRDPVERVQERYRSGELTEAEFEAELDRVLDPDRGSGEQAESDSEPRGRAEDRARERER